MKKKNDKIIRVKIVEVLKIGSPFGAVPFLGSPFRVVPLSV
jgi:hypothetical protein